MALLFPETPEMGTDLNRPNITLQDLGSVLKAGSSATPTPTATATVTGNLQAGGVGVYGFNVNLGSGAISSGVMNGQINPSDRGYSLYGGTGLVRGNDFSVTGFSGTYIDPGNITYTNVGQSTLSGTAAKGFGAIGDIGATGTFEIKDGGTSKGGGTITDGARVN